MSIPYRSTDSPAYPQQKEHVGAHQDLIQAKRQLATLVAGIPAAQTAAEAAVKATRNRLMLLGVSSKDLNKMDRADKPSRHVKIRSSYGGTVLELFVHQEAYVNVGTPMLRVIDLFRLRMQFDAYESDLARIEVKQKVELCIDSFPGETFEGKVSFVDLVVVRGAFRLEGDLQIRGGRRMTTMGDDLYRQPWHRSRCPKRSFEAWCPCSTATSPRTRSSSYI